MITISMHGGHSGQFCDHARDDLSEIVATYHVQGFACVGLSEHMPPASDSWLYPDERVLGRDATFMHTRFARYVQEARRLQGDYHGRMSVLVGMETEWYPACGTWIQALRNEFALDYVVGSVHHVRGLCFDFSHDAYVEVQARCGGLRNLYLEYFDAQLEMLAAVRPEIVGHFDLIRLYDPSYHQTLLDPVVWGRVVRNLECVREIGAAVDVNARALLKGQAEPYVCAPILERVADMGIAVAYGDDAHGVRDVGFGRQMVSVLFERYGLSEMAISRVANRAE